MRKSRELPLRPVPTRSPCPRSAPSARYREATVQSKNRCNPWHRRQDKKKPVKKSASKRHSRPRAKQQKEENPNANPGINTEIETGIGERKRGAGCGSNYETQSRWYFPTGLRTKVGEPTAPRHQCFTMALKPAPSRPFLAASAALGSAYGPTCTR